MALHEDGSLALLCGCPFSLNELLCFGEEAAPLATPCRASRELPVVHPHLTLHSVPCLIFCTLENLTTSPLPICYYKSEAWHSADLWGSLFVFIVAHPRDVS